MALTLVTAPSSEPVSRTEAKAHLRVTATDEDTYIDALIIAAREYLETLTRRALLPQTWDLKLDAFNECDYREGSAIMLPKPPVTSITSITYLDTAGASQTWSSSLYRTDFPAGPKAARARITPAYGESYPSTYGVTNAVTIRFVCGYANAASVPEGLQLAMLFLIGYWFENREAAVVDIGNLSELPLAFKALAWPYMVF